MHRYLQVHVFEARNLINRDITSLSDPFLKIRIIDVKGNEQYSKVTSYIKDSLNPIFNITDIIHNKVWSNDAILQLEIWDKDPLSNDFLGKISWDVATLSKDTTNGWYKLLPQKEISKSKDLGDVRVKIYFQTTKGEIALSTTTTTTITATTTTTTTTMEKQTMTKEEIEMLKKMKGPDGVAIATHSYHMKKYRACFTGSKLVEWLISKKIADNKEMAINIGENIRKKGGFHHVTYEHNFKDKNLFYTFSDDTQSKAHGAHHSKKINKNEISLLEVIQTISSTVQECYRIDAAMSETKYYSELKHFRTQAAALIPALKHHAATYKLIAPGTRLGSNSGDYILYEGWLLKKSDSNRHKWNSRYFVLRRQNLLDSESFNLMYYESQEDAIKHKKVRQIILDEIDYCRIASVGKGSALGLRFNITMKNGRKYELQAAKAAVTRAWEKQISTYAVKQREINKKLELTEKKNEKKNQPKFVLDKNSSQRRSGVTHNPKSQSIVFHSNEEFGFAISGLVITNVQAGSQAEKAGVSVGWYIVSINNHRFDTQREVEMAIAESKRTRYATNIVFIFQRESTNDVVYEGWVKKKSAKNRHKWQPRFFVLTKDGKIFYFKTIQESHKRNHPRMIKCFDIGKAEIAKKGKGSSDQCRFNLYMTKGRSYELMTATKEQCQEWHHFINLAATQSRIREMKKTNQPGHNYTCSVSEALSQELSGYQKPKSPKFFKIGSAPSVLSNLAVNYSGRNSSPGNAQASVGLTKSRSAIVFGSSRESVLGRSSEVNSSELGLEIRSSSYKAAKKLLGSNAPFQ